MDSPHGNTPGNIPGPSEMESLRLFADVARCHSVSQAATLHGISQSAASQRLGHLEKRLGVTLIDRSVRPLALTEAGKVYLAGCNDVIERYDRLEQRVRQLGRRGGGNGQADAPPLEGTVRIASIYSAGIDLLDRARQRFQERQPRVRVDIGYEKPDEVYRRVLEGECDLGILSYPQRWRKVGVLPLREEPMGVVCHPGHALAGRKSIDASELGPFEMVNFDLDLPVGRRVRRYLKEHGSEPKVAHSFDNLDTLKAAVSVTDRFAILPVRTVRREVEAGTLAVVPLTPELVRPIGVIFRGGIRGGLRGRDLRGGARGLVAPAVRAFVDFLLRYAGPTPPEDSSPASSPARPNITANTTALVGAHHD